MDRGAKQDEMARRLKAQVKQGKEHHYVQVLNIEGAANAASAERCNVYRNL